LKAGAAPPCIDYLFNECNLPVAAFDKEIR